MGIVALLALMGFAIVIGDLGSSNSDDTPDPDVGEPDIDAPDVDQPDVDQPVADEPDVDEPDIDEPDVDQPVADEPDVDEPDVDEPDVTNILVQGDDTLITGTDGQDLFFTDPDGEGSLNVTLRGGGGDDSFELGLPADGGPAGGRTVGPLEVFGEAGNDSILAEDAALSMISGGDGDDTIGGSFYGLSTGLTINGDAGDDSIQSSADAGSRVHVSGGLGDDTIDVRGSENVFAAGGDGNDQIILNGIGSVGAQYLLGAVGGAGDDTLTYEVSGDSNFGVDELYDQVAPARLEGGDGADTFERKILGQAYSVAEFGDDTDPVRPAGAIILDFELGTDVVQFDLSELNEDYEATQAQMVVSPSGESVITLMLEGDNLIPQEIRVGVGATGLTWDDVVFVGDDDTPIELLPIVSG